MFIFLALPDKESETAPFSLMERIYETTSSKIFYNQVHSKKETRADRGNFVNCRRSGTIRVGHNVIHKVLINAGECVLCFKTRRVTWHCVF